MDVMTQEIALLMVCSVACAFGHLLPGPYLYLRLTLMRTFLLPSPDYRVVMTHTGCLGKSLQSRAEFLEVQRMDIEPVCLEGSDEAAHNGEKGLHHSYDCFHPNLTEVIISAEEQ